jgi:hypothetical protein
MYTLANDHLEVQILDPLADQERFGVRYCTGGYIFQVLDPRHGPLLTGPTYPESFNWFDGQGIPDAFNLSPLREHEPDQQALVIGIGLCDLTARTVLAFCSWEVTHTPTSIHMQTSHAYAGFGLTLERTVTLAKRSIRTTARLRNTGERSIPLRWFPHPFFPQPADGELCQLNLPVTLPADSPYHLAESGFLSCRNWPEVYAGHFQALEHPANAPLVVLQRHPQLGLIAATCSYTPGFFPVWGNRQTFSWEPFYERTIAVGGEEHWGIDYHF